jgi:Xaa-Pro aminopeptidase
MQIRANAPLACGGNARETLPPLSGASAPMAVTSSARSGGLPFIERAVSVTDEAIRKVQAEIRPGMTEKQMARLIEGYFASQGFGQSFPTISVAGAGTTAVHGKPSDRIIQPNDIIMVDIGAQYDGAEGPWCSDVTRTFFLGEPTPRQQEVWDIVHEAQRKALALVKPGATAGSIDKAARDYVRSKGFDIPHAVGHGVGRKVHERPLISNGNETRLQVGDVITVEPGIYSRQDGFGVRVEDILVVTEDGYRMLSKAPYTRASPA